MQAQQRIKLVVDWLITKGIPRYIYAYTRHTSQSNLIGVMG